MSTISVLAEGENVNFKIQITTHLACLRTLFAVELQLEVPHVRVQRHRLKRSSTKIKNVQTDPGLPLHKCIHFHWQIPLNLSLSNLTIIFLSLGYL